MTEITGITITIVNIVLSLICTFEILLIFKITSEKQFRQNLMKKALSIMELLNSLRLVFLAAVVYCVTQVYYLSVQIGAREIPLMYEFFGTAFLYMLAIGLYRFYTELKRMRELVVGEG